MTKDTHIQKKKFFHNQDIKEKSYQK